MQEYRGFTLPELLVAMALIAILTLTALPSLRAMTRQNHLTATVNALVATLHLARQRAVEAAQDVVVCPLDNLGQCKPDGDWHRGWVIFRNRNREYPPSISPGDPVIKRHRLVGKHAQAIEANRNVIIFRPLGSAVAGTLQICPETGQPGRAVIISRVGRVRTDDKIPSGGVPDCHS